MVVEEFNVNEWLKTVDIWDPKYDYVMHNDHWLTSNYSTTCELCLKHGPIQSETIQDHQQEPGETVSSPPKINHPPIPVTPIAPAVLRSKAFVTPHSTAKFNDTFSRMTRQSARKLGSQKELNETHLISLSETRDLYTSALADTPDPPINVTSTITKSTNITNSTPAGKLSNNDTWNLLGPQTNTCQQQGNTITKQGTSRPMTNYEILMDTNHMGDEPKSNGSSSSGTSRSNLSKNDLYMGTSNDINIHQNLQEIQQQANSRIPRIPVRSSRP